MHATTVKRSLAIAVAVALVLGSAAGAFRYWMSLPLYRTGMASAGASLSAPLIPPPQGPDPNRWIVEPGIELDHLAVGAGENTLVVHGGPRGPITVPWAGLDTLKDRFRFISCDQRGCGRSTRPIDKFGPS